VSAQLWALAVVGIVVLAAACLEIFRSRRARRLALRPSGPSGHLPKNGEENPYILYFTGDSCTVCRTHQEPALAKLGDVRVDKVDAVAERTLADRFHVYTLPTTVVMAADGRAVHVNYGYAPAPKLERQLAEARGRSLSTATA
jgi:thioredoxin-like negative regulator of GroEL